MQADRAEQVDSSSLAIQTSDEININQSNVSRATGSQLSQILKVLLDKALDNEAFAIVGSLEDDDCLGFNEPGRELEEQAISKASQKKLPLDELKTKPLIWLIKMQLVSEKGKKVAIEEDHNDCYWATMVSLPEVYHFSGNTYTNEAQRLFFIDACNINQESFSQQMLRHSNPLGLGHMEVETHFTQQASYPDSGWWALYHGQMIISTGGSHYLPSLQGAMFAFPTEELKQLFSSPELFQEHRKIIEGHAAKEHMREQVLQRAKEKARLKKLKKDHATQQTVLDKERKELESKTSSVHATSVSSFSLPQSQGATGMPVAAWGWYGFYPQSSTSGASSQAPDLEPDHDFSPST